VRYRCERIEQFDGSAFASWNCVSAGSAELVDMATVGRIRLDAAAVRRASGVTARRGLSLTEAADAVVRLTHGAVILEPHYFEADGTARGKVQARVAAGQPLGIVIDTNITAGTPFRTGGATYTFRGNHFVTIAAYRWQAIEKPHAEFFVEDPGRPDQSWTWWPADLLYRAAEAVQGGRIWVLTARDTEGVTRVTRAKGKVRREPELTAPAIASFGIGHRYLVTDTLRGGPWPRANGTKAFGWHHVRRSDGSRGYIRGDRLA
jgi:hypothetical protein